MTAGRKPHTDPPVEWAVNVPLSLATEVMLYLPRDVVKGKIKHGARSKLLQQLLRDWLKQQQEAQHDTKNVSTASTETCPES